VNCAGQAFGSGAGGVVHQGYFDGRLSALKIASARSATEMAAMSAGLRNEVSVYTRLSPLQGAPNTNVVHISSCQTASQSASFEGFLAHPSGCNTYNRPCMTAGRHWLGTGGTVAKLLGFGKVADPSNLVFDFIALDWCALLVCACVIQLRALCGQFTSMWCNTLTLRESCKSCRLYGTALSVLKEVTVADGKAAQEALHSVHHYGVCHGDISDDNILVFRDEAGASFATILDFGHSSIDADSDDMRAEAGQLAYLFAERVSASPPRVVSLAGHDCCRRIGQCLSAAAGLNASRVGG